LGLTKPSCTKGRKRHTAVDTFGLVLGVVLAAASVPEPETSKQVLPAVYQMRQRVSRLYLIGVDRGDSGDRFLKWAMDSLGWMIQVVLRPQQTQGFVLLKKRSVVEQTFGWLNWYRRFSKDDRRLPASSQAMIYISRIPLIAVVSLSE
jgi:putative transposase